MASVRFISGMLLVTGMALLTGCQTASQAPLVSPPTAEERQSVADERCNPSRGVSQEACRYLAILQYAIQRNFNNPAAYTGRECAVTIAWHHSRYNVLSTAGDEALCLKAWSVIGSTEHLPPPPQQMPQKMVIDFKPQ